MLRNRTLAAVIVALVGLAACTSAPRALTTSTAQPAPATTAAATSGSPPPPTRPTPSTATTTQQRSTAATVRPAAKARVAVRAARPTVPARPTTDPLTGGRPSSNPVIAAKIDNTYFEVPQFGVADADIVFVEQVEGGLTRLIAIFHTVLPTEVGPVRSVRSTDAQLLPAFGTPALVFAGGAGGPLTALAATRIVDTTPLVDAYFRSDAASGTYNLHANIAQVARTARGLGPARSIGMVFAARSADIAAGRPASHIQVVMEAGVTSFELIGGRLVRIRDGQPVLDYQGRVEAADNVLVQNVTDQPDGTVDTLGAPSYLTKTVGSGTLTLFRNGRMVRGTWQRARATDPFRYLDSAGHLLPFKPGQTWIVLAPQSAQLTVS